MIYKLVTVLIATCLLACTPVYAATSNQVEQTISDVIQPAFIEFKKDTEKLETTVNDNCGSEGAKEAYRNAARSFSVIEFIQLGPLLSENRLERLFFWPDRKAIGQRQIRQLLLEPTLAELSLSDLQGKSVALQGFPALGRILFQKQPIENSVCYFASVIATNLDDIAEVLVKEWQSPTGIASALNNPSHDSQFRDDKESLAAVLKLADAGLRSLVDGKLSRIIKGGIKKNTLIKSAPFYYGGLTFDHLHQNLEFIASIMVDTRLTKSAIHVDQIIFEFDRSHRMLDAAEEALAIDNWEVAFQRLVALKTFLNSLHRLLIEEIMTKNGVTSGFNGGDGD